MDILFTFLAIGATISWGLLNSGIILNGFGFIGFAIYLFEWPSGDFIDIISLAFDSISIPIKVEMLSIPSKSSLYLLYEADDIPPF